MQRNGEKIQTAKTRYGGKIKTVYKVLITKDHFIYEIITKDNGNVKTLPTLDEPLSDLILHVLLHIWTFDLPDLLFYRYQGLLRVNEDIYVTCSNATEVFKLRQVRSKLVHLLRPLTANQKVPDSIPWSRAKLWVTHFLFKP